jgi:hypothetical protein
LEEVVKKTVYLPADKKIETDFTKKYEELAPALLSILSLLYFTS